MKKTGPTFSVKFQSMSRDGSSPYPSLPSVETDDRKQFQCVNIVVNDKTRGNPYILSCQMKVDSLLSKQSIFGSGKMSFTLFLSKGVERGNF